MSTLDKIKSLVRPQQQTSSGAGVERNIGGLRGQTRGGASAVLAAILASTAVTEGCFDEHNYYYGVTDRPGYFVPNPEVTSDGDAATTVDTAPEVKEVPTKVETFDIQGQGMTVTIINGALVEINGNPIDTAFKSVNSNGAFNIGVACTDDEEGIALAVLAQHGEVNIVGHHGDVECAYVAGLDTVSGIPDGMEFIAESEGCAAPESGPVTVYVRRTNCDNLPVRPVNEDLLK